MSRNSNNNQSQEVAVIQPPRMQMPDDVGERYHLNPDSWRALTDAVFPMAKTVGAVVLALAYCERHKLDVFQKVVHIVPMRVGNRDVETVWPGIGQLRVIAHRQPEFAGYDDCLFGPDVEQAFKGKKIKWRKKANEDGYEKAGYEDLDIKVTYPEWAQFIVYKMLHGQRVPLPGPKVWFKEAFAGKSTEDGDVPNEMWAKRPRGQLEKCAEAAAYRRAFPDVLGNEMAAEEMEGRHLDPTGSIEAEYIEVKPGAEQQQAAGPKPAAPKRSDFQQRGSGAAATEPETAEVVGTAESRTEHIRVSPLDEPGIPENDAQWDSFITLLNRRLATFSSVDEVDIEQERQQFRIDAAPLKMQQRLYEIFSDAAVAVAAQVDRQPATAEQPAAEEPTPGAEQELDQQDIGADAAQTDKGGHDEAQSN